MDEQRRFRRVLVLGGGIALIGLLCLLGGIGLLAWRLFRPGEVEILPPSAPDFTEYPPTTALLLSPLAPPPLPDDPAQVVILPVSARATPMPTPTITRTARPVTPSPTPAQFFSPTVPPITVTPTPTPTFAATSITTPLPMWIAPPPDRILIDDIGLDVPVIPMGQHPIQLGDQVFSQWDVPNFRAAGWHQSSARPGQPGNIILNGHHNTSGEVFRWLTTLKPGSLITLLAGERRYPYIVVQTIILPEEDQSVQIRQDNARWILPTRDERVTLVTCWPYSANTHRLVVVALPLAVVIPPDPIP
jgi:sortase A